MSHTSTKPVIPFNRPAVTGREKGYVAEAIAAGKFSGGGEFNNRCNRWLETSTAAAAALVTPSCTHALEMAALLCELSPGDEVILPSYAFTSTATAFARCGARLVFVDIEPATMNIDSEAVAEAVTERTKVIVALHYAGVSCDMEKILTIAKTHNLKVVEDAAQALMASYRGSPCGLLGDYGCYSFHETKNIHCGEGGALLISNPDDIARAEAILEKGTNRRSFARGEVNKYTWIDIGSSYVPSELNCAFLLAQLEAAEEITRDRLRVWNEYHEAFVAEGQRLPVEIPDIPVECAHNGHIYWLKCDSEKTRSALIDFLNARGIRSTFHYVPLHSSRAGKVFGEFAGEDRYTSRDSARLIRLPIYYEFDGVGVVTEAVKNFFQTPGRPGK